MEFKIQFKKLRKCLNLKQLEFGKIIGHTQRGISELENGKRSPSKTLIKLLEYLYGNIESWDRIKPHNKIDKNGTPVYKEEKPDADADPKINELLNMASEVLSSKTNYADTLTSTIRGAHNAVKTEKRLNNMESRLKKIENGVKNGKCCVLDEDFSIPAKDAESDTGT